eukprot:7604746-Alexandrium_andersonii.AAC.1
MSASLVGSEMCIRDRPRSTTPGWTRRRSLWPSSGRGSTIATLPPPPVRCLLYTSDAADDM